MTQTFDTEKATPLIAPLRMRYPDGTPYVRPPEVEEPLAVLLRLPASELVERARIDDPKNPSYVSSECVLYFVRHSSVGGDALRDLFVILRQRVLRAVPVLGRRAAGSTKTAEKAGDLDIQEAVLDDFQKLLCGDRVEYDDRLDFYEIRFNEALARLRITARRSVGRRESRYVPSNYEGDTNEPAKEVESALAALKNTGDGEIVDFLYRSKLYVAISTLPPDERRVVELLLQELPIDSKEKDVLTIVKVLGCSEKTVRNRRKQAFAKLRDALKEEEDV